MMIHHMKKPLLILMLVAMFCTAIGGSALAQNKNNDKGNSHWKGSIDVATAVTMIVKGLKLNIDNIRFIKEPKASDYYTKVKDTAPYAGDFIIAQFNGLELPKDINPTAKVTREQFAKWLYGALSHKGEYAWIDIYYQVADEKQVTEGYMDSIQKLLIAKIATLDGKKKFYPKGSMTQATAAVMINRTLKFIADSKPITPAPEVPENPILTDVKVTSDKVTDDVTKVTVSAMAPHPGYGLEITGIQFAKGEAVIQYRVVLPDPNKMFAQVVTELKAVTYIPAGYKAVLGEAQPTVPFPG
ncbi:S-layer homology domain-containing protein [Cohnella luojiensis]|uniref:S-layer homology domain-containing protein n=1 Tax=Cohnella luojiensis TaxID=652876 RepID=A0A4Y8M876_9BACL|nr:S-layer homology domain-containing protein [Cohnella luojiensis]TFE31774.1 S-layer homology domain-containing protein [Cohnella luojiensis]